MMRPSLVALSLLLAVGAAFAGDEPPAAPTPEPTAAAPRAPLRLDLGDLTTLQEGQGHAEFDLGLRREMWNDRMTRLAYAISREQAAQMRGAPIPRSATDMLIVMPGPDLAQVLAGPFASDWRDLTPQERMGRMGESVVYWSLAIAILSSVHRP
jgi:hypothetical protein